MRDFDRDLAHLHRALAEHVRREQPLAKALVIVSEECADKRLRGAVERIRKALESGTPVGEAWAQGAPDIPALYSALIDAASKSGDLAAALDQIGEHAARSSSVTLRLRQALFGPAVTAIACLAFGILAATVAGPGLVELTVATTGNPPILLVGVGVGVLVLFVLGAFVLTRMRSPMSKGRFSVPVLGPLRLNAVRADVATTLALLLRRGIALPKATALTREAVPAGAARGAVGRMHDSASQGAGVCDALEAGQLYDGSTLWLVEAADGSSDVVDALDDVADVHRRRLERGVERMGVVARPLAEVVVGIAVFCFAYSYAAPLFEYIEWVAGI